MSVPITEEIIRQLDRKIRAEVDDIYSMNFWAHPYWKTTIGTRSGRALGTASSSGEICISKAFIGGTSYEALEDTLRHEYAHLAVGVYEKHGNKWREMAQLFGATPKARSKHKEHLCELTQAQLERSYKYTLVAHLEDGTSRALKGVNRRQRARLEYKPKMFSYYRIGDLKIIKFTYEPNK